jgi:preprotein translocase subunit SecG
MGTLQLILCIVLLVLAVFLVVVVLLQSGKTDKLSGTITGASSDSFYGKAKGRTADAILSKLTAVAAVLFALIVVAVYIVQTHTVEPEAAADTDESVSESELADGTEAAADVEESDTVVSDGAAVGAEEGESAVIDADAESAE